MNARLLIESIGRVCRKPSAETRLSIGLNSDSGHQLSVAVASIELRYMSVAFVALALTAVAQAQQPPYDKFPEAKPPYYRVRYPASAEQGELIFPVSYTVWVPPGGKTLRGVIVHQHGCGEGSCRSGLTGAFDLHWQALAAKHQCALLAAAYEQPQQADCQRWCDPRNGSGQRFQQALVDLGKQAEHPELAKVPWALWGHSGGGHWAGGMLLLHPQRVAAAWLRSGVPLLEENPDRPKIRPHQLPAAALAVPIMCNLGTKEGVSVTQGRFAKVWPANQKFFQAVRERGGLIGVAVDPLTAHECGNQRYLAIRWLDACLTARLPEMANQPLRSMPAKAAWFAEPLGTKALPRKRIDGQVIEYGWLPNVEIAKVWEQYVADSKVSDVTPPPPPATVTVEGAWVRFEPRADVESGLQGFIIKRDGKVIAELQGQNRYGRPLYQGLQYSDTPTFPLKTFEYRDDTATPGRHYRYEVLSINTVGLKSTPAVSQ